MENLLKAIEVIILIPISSCNFDHQRVDRVNEPIKKNIFSKTKYLEIYVQYNPSIERRVFPKWILINSNYKELNWKTAERIFIKSKNDLKMNKLDSLSEKQNPLVLKLNGFYKTDSLNDFRVFQYSKYSMVEF